MHCIRRGARSASISLLIYADREHSANLAWLTGFDPRFEEALLIVAPGHTPTLLAGPEISGGRRRRRSRSRRGSIRRRADGCRTAARPLTSKRS